MVNRIVRRILALKQSAPAAQAGRCALESLEARQLLNGDPSLAVASDFALSDHAQFNPAVAPAASYAAPSTFATRTPRALRAPYQLTATATSYNQIHLEWRDTNPNDIGFRIERSVDGQNWVYRSNVPRGTQYFNDKGLKGNRKYYYRVQARTTAGNSGYSNIASATTSNPRVAPAEPSALRATPLSYYQIRLTWQDNSTNETQFVLERSTDGSNFTEIARPLANQRAYIAKGLNPGTTYYFRILAHNMGGDSDYSASASATTPALPPAPDSPSGLSARALSYAQIEITWTDGSSNESGFVLQVSSNGTQFNSLATTAANTARYVHKGLRPSTTYYYRVASQNAGGLSQWSDVVSATTQAPPSPPAAPTNLTVSPASSARLNLAWRDNASNETGCVIERSTDGVSFKVLTVTAANVTSYANVGLAAGTTYYYRVAARNIGGNSAYTDIVNATTLPRSGAPAAPGNLTATALGGTQVRLAWRDFSSNETGFIVERSTDGNVYNEVTTTAQNATGYTNMGLTPNTQYFYRVRARNLNGLSAYAGPVSVRTTVNGGTPAAPADFTATPLSPTSIQLRWRDQSSDETGFVVERSTDNTHFSVVLNVPAGNTATVERTDSGLQESTKYYYRVYSRNGSGTSAFASASATTPAPSGTPAAPSDLRTFVLSTSQIQLSWNDNSDDESVFVVERSTDGVNFAEITRIYDFRGTYLDRNLPAKTTLYYRVAARNANGRSAYSNTASATTL